MISFKRIKALFFKESLQIIRDPSSILIAAVLPLLLLFLMGYAISLDSKNIPISIIVEKPSKHTQSLINAFEISSSFDVKYIENTRVNSHKKIQESKIKAIIVIPETFEKDILKNSPKLQILADATEPNIAGYIYKYGFSVWQNWLSSQGYSSNALINIESRYWFNAPLLSSYFLLPGSIAIILTLIGTLLTALVVAREWERGTMEAILSTPITPFELIVGKTLPYFILAMFSMIICVFITLTWFEIPFRGSYWLLLITASVYLIPSLALGLLISTLAKNQFVAAQVALIAGFLPAMLLSGFIFQISSMPTWLQYLTSIIPAKYFIPILQTLFLSGNIYEIIIPNLLFMLVFGILIFAIIIKITRKKIE